MDAGSESYYAGWKKIVDLNINWISFNKKKKRKNVIFLPLKHARNWKNLPLP